MKAGFKSLSEFLDVRNGNDPVETIANQGFLIEPSSLAAAAVRVTDKPGGIRHHDHGLGVIENLAAEIAFALQLRLEVLHVGNVEEHAAILQHLAMAVANNKSVFQSVNQASIAAAKRHLIIADKTLLANRLQ